MRDNDAFVILSSPRNIIRDYLEDVVEQTDIRYRLSKYVICRSIPDGTLCYSTLTGSLILIKDFEQARATLIKERILVPEDEDEKAFVDTVRQKCQAAPFETNPCNHYWILPSTACNARCFYCFERGYKAISMSAETAIQTAEFISNNCGPSQVILHWYGGEPLVNVPAIDLICKHLRTLGIPFYSEITTNGFLFSPELSSRALLDWNLTKAIVTIDGTEAIYNKTKAFIHNSSISPFKVVMTNVESLVDQDVQVVVRTNIGKFNMYDVTSLYEEITIRFLEKDNVTIYPHLVSNPPGGDIEMDSSLRREIYSIIRSIRAPWRKRKKSIELYDLPGFVSGRGLEFTGKQLVIKPDGELAVHPDLFLGDHFGSVYEGFKVDSERLQQYLLEEDKTQICESCPIYPTCFKRKIEFNSTVCTQADYEKCLERSERNMLNLYETIKNLPN